MSIFKFMVFRLLEQAFAIQKMNLDIFIDVSQTNFFPRFLLSAQAEVSYSFPPSNFFSSKICFPAAEMG